MRFRFLKLSIVRIFLKAADQAKKAFIKGTFLPLGEGSIVMGAKSKIERFDLKQPSLGRGPNKVVFHASSHPNRKLQIEERGEGIHLLIMRCSKKTKIPRMRITKKL